MAIVSSGTGWPRFTQLTAPDLKRRLFLQGDSAAANFTEAIQTFSASWPPARRRDGAVQSPLIGSPPGVLPAAGRRAAAISLSGQQAIFPSVRAGIGHDQPIADAAAILSFGADPPLLTGWRHAAAAQQPRRQVAQARAALLPVITPTHPGKLPLISQPTARTARAHGLISADRSAPHPSPLPVSSPSGSPTPSALTTASTPMAVGMNLESIVDWSPAWTFTDIFQASRPWINQVFNTKTWATSWDDPASPLLNVAPDGTVRSLGRWTQNGVELRQQAATLMFRDIGGAYPAGRYVAEWDGSGDVRFGFDAAVVSTSRTTDGHNRSLLDVTPSDAGIYLRIETTDPADPVRNIHLWMPDYGGQSFTGQRWQPGASFSPFHPLFLERLAPFGTIRFMGMQESNSSDITTWSQRRTTTAARQSSGAQGKPSEPLVNGMALETMIELANALDADPWFNMPFQADDDFVRQFATTVRNRLETGRKVYVEWANEVWNFGWGFEASQWVADQVQREGLDPNEGQWIVAGREARRDMEIWSQVFAGQSDHTLVRVAAGWAAVDWVSNRIAEEMRGAFDAIAIAPYITPTDAQRASYSASTTVDQVLADTRSNIATSVSWVSNHAALADAWSARLGRPIDLLAYEGGIHLDGRGAPYQNAFYAAGLTPQMGEIYRDYLQAIDQAGLDLYMDFQFTGKAGAAPWGDFAKLHRMDEPLAGAYRYNAVADAALAGSGGSVVPTLAIAPLSAVQAEGQSGGTVFTFTLTRSGNTNGSSSVDWSVVGSGASPAVAADFSGGALPRGRQSFAAGETSRTLSIQVAADSFVEPDDGFSLNLSNPVGATLAAASASGTILNDDNSSDRTAPALLSLAVEGNQLLLGFSETVVTAGLQLQRFGVTVNATGRTVTSVGPGADGRQLRLSFSGTAPTSAQSVRLVYSDVSGTNDESGVVQDPAGNDLATITAPGQAADTFFSAVSVSALASTTSHLILTGTAAINATGNAGNNTLSGNSAANSLNGGAGIDTLIGGEGNDIYVVDSTTDTIREESNGGSADLVQSSVSFSLAAHTRVEHLSLSGNAAINGTGNALANSLSGNGAANSLNGGDGHDTLNGMTGNDTLTGGNGDDTFSFTTALNASSNRDVITDFVSGTDKLSCSKLVFKGFSSTATTITSSQFRSGAGITTATTTSDRFLYDSSTGLLRFDDDGSRSASKPITVALLGTSSHPVLAFTDFVLTA